MIPVFRRHVFAISNFKGKNVTENLFMILFCNARTLETIGWIFFTILSCVAEYLLADVTQPSC